MQGKITITNNPPREAWGRGEVGGKKRKVDRPVKVQF